MVELLKKCRIYGKYRALCFWIINHLLVGLSPWKCKCKIILLNSIGCSIGTGTRIVGPIECSGALTVGNNTFIGKYLKVNGNGFVRIGDNCDIGPEVTFQTGGHIIEGKSRRAGQGCIYTQEVGNGTWICGRVTILKDTRIGCGCVVAGCACVISDIEENTLVGGVPAKVIRRLE